MPIRPALSRRDAILILLGASIMHIFTIFFPHESAPPEILIDTPREQFLPDPPPPPPEVTRYHTRTTTLVQATTTTATVVAIPSAGPASASPLDLALEFPATTLIAHAPGWTLFKDLYMSNGTFFIVTDSKSEFPKIPLMASHPLTALNEPENIRQRMPTPYNMDFLTLAEAHQRWGDDVRNGKKNRVLSVAGNTVLVNEPRQFLRHYYHLVAELFFGVQAFWHGAFSAASTDIDRDYMLGPHPAPPPIDRVIFARSNADGWRDGPGFNAYFMRAAFPSTTIEVEDDWNDRVTITTSGDRAWHFPLLLLTDRSASHRGDVCGSQTQRIAAEAFVEMRRKNQLVGLRVGGWWEPVRSAVLRFAGAEVQLPDYSEQVVFDGDNAEGDPRLPMPAKIVITYISRQSAGQRKLTPESHDELVKALKDLQERKGDKWELNVVEAEKITKDEQLKIAARTTILLGVHGNGLTHLVMMQPTRISTVIEMFYPEGFAHDYQWTTRALGMKHFAVWNDTYRTEGRGEGKPQVNYPDPGFQGNFIPVHGPSIAKLIEDRVEGRVVLREFNFRKPEVATKTHGDSERQDRPESEGSHPILFPGTLIAAPLDFVDCRWAPHRSSGTAPMYPRRQLL
ncbi:hypothetical protein MVEN_01976700 [Mycena venus]|uniref:Glycosyltransferase 61 catalytic domain-containing protein n=1 Tax=Mycena venus TaxID=2733690 RepID=A0A8H6XEK7_9AGAR|nr:hypothetical protein MVEN_01976700 [Mycena venus]